MASIAAIGSRLSVFNHRATWRCACDLRSSARLVGRMGAGLARPSVTLPIPGPFDRRLACGGVALSAMATTSATAIQALGPIEASAVLRTGARRRNVLAANTVLGDLFCMGGDRLLRMYNPKGGKLRCVQQLRPQLLDDAFVRATPGFWSQPFHEQRRLVAEAHGERSLDVPHEVVAIELHESSGFVALIGVHRVSILVLPPAASLSAPPDAADELGTLLSQLGLSEYGSALRENGYDHVGSLLRMNGDERHTMAQTVGMRPGHAQTLLMHLDGRLPPAAAAAAAAGAHDSGAAVPCWATALPLTGHGDPPTAGHELAAARGSPTPFAPPVATAPSNHPRRCSFGVPMTAATARHSPLIGDTSFNGGGSMGFMSPKSAFRAAAPQPPGSRLDGAARASPVAALGGGAGVVVVQVSWHPFGEAHLAVLLSDGTFHIFDASSAEATPCVTLSVPRRAAQSTPHEPPATRLQIAAGTAAGGAEGSPDSCAPVGFGFGGAAQLGWTSLCVFFGTASGDVYCACPVLPTGRRAAQHLAALAPSLDASLEEEDDDDGEWCTAARAWLRKRTAATDGALTVAGARVSSGVDAPVRVQGPLRFDGDAAVPSRRAISMCCLSLPGGLVGVRALLRLSAFPMPSPDPLSSVCLPSPCPPRIRSPPSVCLPHALPGSQPVPPSDPHPTTPTVRASHRRCSWVSKTTRSSLGC